MAKVLVVYYSRTGYTRRIAQEIAAQCGADTEEIRDTVQRSGILGYLRCAREALSKQEPAIAPATANAASYDVVALGTPVWAGNMASPLRTYLSAHARELKRVAVFCTQGGSGGPKVLDALAARCGAKPVAALVLNDADIDKGRHTQRLQEFVAALGTAR